MANIRDKLQADIHPDYRVDIESLIRSTGLSVTDEGMILLEDVADLPPQALLDIMSRLIGAMEYIESRRALITSLVKQKAADLNSLEATKRLEYLEKREFARGSKTDSELVVSKDPQVVALKKKIATYEAFGQYLKAMYELLSMAHYTAKTALNTATNRGTMGYEG